MYKCIVCGFEWPNNEWLKGGMYVEPGKPITSRQGVPVCVDCVPIIRSYRRRFDDNERELRRITEEWYRVKKHGR